MENLGKKNGNPKTLKKNKINSEMEINKPGNKGTVKENEET